jgi:hypothetical protein
LQQLNDQPIGALAFPLEICPVTAAVASSREILCLQCHDLCRQRSDFACLTTTSWPPPMPYFREIHVHQYFAIIRQ